MTDDLLSLAEVAPDLDARFEEVERYSGGEGWTAAVRPRDGGDVRLLKVLSPGHDVHEGSLLASLEHPAIPGIREVGRTAGGRAFLVRDHLTGVPLSERLPLSAARAVQVGAAVLEVLGYVHLRGILHLDLKPSNILLAPDELTGVRLLDFGLGRRGAGAASGGTFVFAAPEVLLGVAPDARADLFSLGATLFVALHGMPPVARFRAAFPRDGFFAAAGVMATDLPAPFDAVLPRLMARTPDARYGDAQEVLEALTGGSGRPSTALLRPDPIRLASTALAAELAELPPGDSLSIEGGDAVDRRALALHAAVSIGDLTAIEEHAERLVLQRGAAGSRRFSVPEVTVDTLAAHLREVVQMDAPLAARAAHRLWRDGVRTPAAVGRTLAALVDSGAIVPDGPRWIWPAAAAGRRDDGSKVAATPEALERAAARGRVEAAVAAFRDAAPALDDTAERGLRTALVRGLLRAGEAARALPLAHDLPRLRVRALLDRGRTAEALAALEQWPIEHDAVDLRRLRAQAAFATGALERALELTDGLIRQTGGAEDEVFHGLVQLRMGRADDAVATEMRALGKVASDEAPFVRAAALTNMAEAERMRGDAAAAQRYHAEALQIYRSLGHVRHTATSANNLGVLAKDLGQLSRAVEYLRQARRLFAHVGDDEGTALAEANLGIVALEAGDPHDAARRLQEGLARLEQLGSAQSGPFLHVMLARAYAAMGEHEAAEMHLQSAGRARDDRMAREIDKVAEDMDGDAKHRDVPPTVPMAARALDGGVVRTLLAINRRLATEAELDRALQFLLDGALTLTGGRFGFLLVARPDGVQVELQVGDGGTTGRAYSRSMVHRALQLRRVLTSDDVLDDKTLIEMKSVRDLAQRSVICVPFIAASGTQGAIYVEHPGRRGVFGAEAHEVLDALADQAAIAVDRLLHEEQVAAELEQSRRDLRVVRRQLARRQRDGVMIGESPAMKALRQQIDRLAPSDMPVLIVGGTGTGKELVARALHQGSERRNAEMVAENCAAIPAELMEAELFGHTKGAFTGAGEDRPGLLELASGGTLFLDEVGDMPLALQAKLLRALQEGQVRRVGSQKSTAVDLRVIAATHRDLPAMIAAGQFRADLYYRLAAAEIQVPPLRERGEDVLLLAQAFMARLNRQSGRNVQCSPAAEKHLLSYPWPGNVRELEHVVTRAYTLADDEQISVLHLPAMPIAESDEGVAPWPVISLAEAEERTIRAALEHTGGDKTKAARLLGISRTTLYQRLKRMNA